MGKMKMGSDPRDKEFLKVAKRVMEKHKNTFERLADDITPENIHTGSSLDSILDIPTIREDQKVPEPIVREILTVEKQQDIHHHNVINNVKTIDKRTRKYVKALRKEAYNQRENLSKLISKVQKVQAERMDKIEESVKQIPQEKQVVTQVSEVKEIKYVLDKKLLICNVLLLISVLVLILK